MAKSNPKIDQLSDSVGEYIFSTLKVSPGESFGKLMLKELKRVNERLDEANKISAKSAVKAETTETESTPKKSDAAGFFANLKSLPELIKNQLSKKVEAAKENVYEKAQQAAFKLIPKSVVNKVNTTAESLSSDKKPNRAEAFEEKKSELESSKEPTKVEISNFKELADKERVVKNEPKSELESVKETTKVEVSNFNELGKILPPMLKDAFKEIHGDLKELSKFLKTLGPLLENLGGGGEGGGLMSTILEGLVGSRGGKGIFRKLAQRSRIFAKRTVPRAFNAARGAIGRAGTAILASKPAQFIAEKATALKGAAEGALDVAKTKAAPIVEKIVQSKPAQFIAEKAAPIIEKVAEKATVLKEGAIKYGGKALEGLKKLIPGKAGAAVAEKVAESGAGKSVASKIAASIAKRIPKSLGGALAKSIPFLGTAIGVGFAVNRLIKGDYLGAALEAGSGFGSAATAIPATIALLIKDVYEDTYGVKPESDPEAEERMKEIKEKVEQAANDFLGKEKKAPGEKTDKKSEETPSIVPESLKKAVDEKNNPVEKNNMIKGGGIGNIPPQSSNGESVKAPAVTPEPVKEAVSAKTETPKAEAPAITPEPVKEAVSAKTETPKAEAPSDKEKKLEKQQNEGSKKILFHNALANAVGLRSYGGIDQYGQVVDTKGNHIEVPKDKLEAIEKKFGMKAGRPEHTIEYQQAQRKKKLEEFVKEHPEYKKVMAGLEARKDGYSYISSILDFTKEGADKFAKRFAPNGPDDGPIQQAIDRIVAALGPADNSTEGYHVYQKPSKAPEITPEPVKEAVNKQADVSEVGTPEYGETQAPAITPEPVKEAVSAKTETPKAEAPAITPEPVKEAVTAAAEASKPKSAAQEVIDKVNKRREKEKEWIEKGYRSTNDIPKEELEAYTKEFVNKGLAQYGEQILMRSLAMSLTAKGAKADTGSSKNIVSHGIETGEYTATPVEAPSSESKAPAITPEPVKEAVSAAAETPKAEVPEIKVESKAPEITPEPVKEAVSAAEPPSTSTPVAVDTDKKDDPRYRKGPSVGLKSDDYVKEMLEWSKDQPTGEAWLNGVLDKGKLHDILSNKFTKTDIKLINTAARLTGNYGAYHMLVSKADYYQKGGKSEKSSETAPAAATPASDVKPSTETPKIEASAQSSTPNIESQKQEPPITAEASSSPVISKSTESAGSSTKDKNLEEIAKNTKTTNASIESLAKGFATLAKALESLGVSIADNGSSAVINNIASGQSKQKTPSNAYALRGNTDISNFRMGIVEASRFRPI